MFQAVLRTNGSPKVSIDFDLEMVIAVQEVDQLDEFAWEAHGLEDLGEESVVDAVVGFRLVAEQDNPCGVLLGAVQRQILGEVGRVTGLFEELESALV